MLGSFAPGRIAGSAVELPHHAREEPARPIGPQFTLVKPFSVFGVNREKIRALLNERGDLSLPKFKCRCVLIGSGGLHGWRECGIQNRMTVGILSSTCGPDNAEFESMVHVR
jgi:hypothetical protein